jgi:hypothetical protein
LPREYFFGAVEEREKNADNELRFSFPFVNYFF